MPNEEEKTPLRRSSRHKKPAEETAQKEKTSTPSSSRRKKSTVKNHNVELATPNQTPTEDVEMTVSTPVEVMDSLTDALVMTDIKQNLHVLIKAVANFEARYCTRVFRSTVGIRRRLSQTILSWVINAYIPKDHPQIQLLRKYISVPADEDWPVTVASKEPPEFLPEGVVYIGLLVILYFMDRKDYEKGIDISTQLITFIHTLNRRTLDQLGARVFYYHALIHERTDRMEELHLQLLGFYRTASLRHDMHSEATLLNLLYRNRLHFNLYDQGYQFLAKTVFPDAANSNEVARNLYYIGRVLAIRLEYSDAYGKLSQALRKAPQGVAAAGFQQAVYKLSIIVQMLMGEIPERSIFRLPVLRKALVPYLQITKAVRIGDLSKFQQTLATYGQKFQDDKMFTLILRLRHNVIKAGIRKISLSYSRISLRDVCIKLHLDSEEDAEFIVGKAISDGVIDAKLDHANGWMHSQEVVDIYSTVEPMNAFHERIGFCLFHHDELVRAMRFPLDAHRKALETVKAAGERIREITLGIEEGDLDDEDGDEF